MVAIAKYLKYAQALEPVERVVVHIFDIETTWEPSLDAIIDEFDVPVAFDISFEKLDVSDPSTWEETDFSEYDMVTASFFVSEIAKLKLGMAARKFWKFVLKGMRPGGLVAFNDNNDERIYGYFDRICDSVGGFEVIVKDQEEVSCGDSFEPVQKMINRMDHRPRKNGDTAYRLLRKS